MGMYVTCNSGLLRLLQLEAAEGTTTIPKGATMQCSRCTLSVPLQLLTDPSYGDTSYNEGLLRLMQVGCSYEGTLQLFQKELPCNAEAVPLVHPFQLLPDFSYSNVGLV